MTEQEENHGEWAVRIWRECRGAVGFEKAFLIYCMQNHIEVIDEFMEFDQMMGGG
jgi:hypothetical protein